MRRTWPKWIGLLLGAMAAVVYLEIGRGSGFTIYMLTTVFIYASLASSLDLLVGLTGRVSFAHGAFFGLAAYVTGLTMMRWNLPFAESALLAVAGNAVMAFLVGMATIRVSGMYFALAMTALAVVFVSVIELPELTALTGGATGLAGLPFVSYLSGQNSWYLVFLLILVIGLALKAWIADSRLGMCMIAVRDDEELARTLGLKTNFYKVLAFVIAACLASVTGAFFAIYFGSLAPSDFDIWASFNMVVWVLVGGAGTLLGPVLGVALLWTVPQLLNFDPNVNLLIYGALLIVIILFKRGGIMGLVSDSWLYIQRHIQGQGGRLTMDGSRLPLPKWMNRGT